MIKSRTSVALAGFGLIEVLVAMLLIAVMAAALLPLSQRYLTASRDGRQTEVALRLAESKLDALRHLNQQSGHGSSLQPQPLPASGQDSVLVMDVEFTRTWTVSSARWSPAQQAWLASPATESGKQAIGVTVSWQNSQGQRQFFSLNSAMAALSHLEPGPLGARP